MPASRRKGRYDAAVVGAGVVGLSIAYHLAELGLAVAVVERTGVAAGASGVQPGGVRQQWSSRPNCLLARESLTFYREIGERLGTRLQPHFSACGYMFVAHRSERLAELAAAVDLQAELGIPARMLTAEETAGVVPELDPRSIVGAAWCAEDGYFDQAREPIEAFAEAAWARGAELLIDEVAGLGRDGSGWHLRLVGGEGVAATNVVVAAGCDTRPILRSVGLDLPVQAETRVLFLSEPIRERLLEPLVVATDIGFAAKQLADGRVLASDLQARGDPALDRARWLATVRAGCESLLPRLQMVSFPHLISGIYDVSPDNNPFLGAFPGTDGLWVAAGFSGHGFMLAPAVGRILAGAVAGGPTDPLLEPFGVERLTRTGRGAETHII